MITKLFFTFLLLTFITINGFTQINKIANSIDSIVAEIDSSNVYELTYTVGYTGTISKQYLRLQKLSEMASEKELTDLALNYKSPVVRLYALRALKQKQILVTENVIAAFSNDKSRVNTLSGCYGGISSVAALSKVILRLSKPLHY